ncbi:hypothetical protein ABCS02_24880 [Microbacterium sp. X-17]|uniref:hypothetical protein n=1 Tax=Microbacterium sp. X-17 TaxID=3144404 RepID=UPI0031F4A62A
MADREVPTHRYLAPTLVAVQVVVAAGTSLLAWLQRLSLDSCASASVTCDTGLMWAAGDVFFVVAALLLAGTMALLFTLARRRTEYDDGSLTWVPALGISLTVIAYVISALVFQSAI